MIHTRKLPRLLQSLRTLESSFTFCNRYSNLPRNNRVACTGCYTARSFQQCLITPFCTSLRTSFWYGSFGAILVRHFWRHFSTPFWYVTLRNVIFGAIWFVIFGATLVRHFCTFCTAFWAPFLVRHFVRNFGTFCTSFWYLNVGATLVRHFVRHFCTYCTSFWYVLQLSNLEQSFSKSSIIQQIFYF